MALGKNKLSGPMICLDYRLAKCIRRGWSKILPDSAEIYEYSAAVVVPGLVVD